ncbi:hypothetical protein ACFQV4_23775 [Streptomyces thermocarboxydus]
MADTPGPDGRPPGRPAAATPLGRFRAEARDAITPRTGLLILGVLILELAFVVSYIGAFHSPPRSGSRWPWWPRRRSGSGWSTS